MTEEYQPQTYLLCDGANLFHRMIHMVNPASGIDMAIGYSFHLMLYSMKKEWNRFNGSHLIFFIEGSSWRKFSYSDYKADRKVKYALKTDKEKEDQTILTEAFDDLVNFFDQKSNITVLQNPQAEADDMIAEFIRHHPNDNHILISSDSDFYQLLAPNLKIYDPVKDILITQNSVTNDNGKNMSFIMKDGKLTKLTVDPYFIPDNEWYRYALFLKIVRGDSTDNIFSAYPGAREKGSKNNVGIREAYEDKDTKGFNWNNFVNQRWTDHNNVEQRVKDVMERNRILIDLTAQPDEIKESCKRIIDEQVSIKSLSAPQIGMNFLQFCTKWDLKKISDNAQGFMTMLKSNYKKV